MSEVISDQSRKHSTLLKVPLLKRKDKTDTKRNYIQLHLNAVIY